MASRIQGITVEIGGDITKLSKALGYYVSVAKGLDVDKPRNLAKSVTVE